MERWEGVQSVCILESASGTTILRRDFGDTLEDEYLMGVIINKPGLVAAVGGIPNELKIEGAVTFWFPSPVSIYSKIKLSQNSSECQQFKLEHYESAEYSEYIKLFRRLIARNYIKACRASSSTTCKQQAEVRNLDPRRLMVEANFLESQSLGSASDDELNKDNDG
ncbi:uncharacterized protein LOC130995511 isoform X2 [Salvia miltiorrhiza]|nr:uncharacterized protein LOC130995511 isoform X2 [Salvia miltiorrhiza]